MLRQGGKQLMFAGLIAGLFLGFLGNLPVQAATPQGQEQESIAISPVSKLYKFDAGTTRDDEITVINGGSTVYTFKVYASPYSVTGVEYTPDFFTNRTNTDIQSWVKFAQTTYRLEAGKSVTVPYSIVVPADATPGGHYAVIFAETQPSGNTPETNSVERRKRIGSLVYATVKGAYEMGGRFNGIRTPGLQFKAPLKSELNVENTGNSDFAVDTVFAVSDLFGSRKFTDTKQYRLLPKTERKIELAWSQAPGFGVYEVTVSAKFLDQETTRTSYVLMAPIAFYMIFIMGLFVLVIYFVQKHR
jgi:hypothetical protein